MLIQLIMVWTISVNLLAFFVCYMYILCSFFLKDSHGGVKELVFPKALDLDRPKRARTTFSPEQLYQLEKEFQRNQYLVGKERTELAKQLKLSETQVSFDMYQYIVY